jgi:hypothetical protein
MDAIRSGVITPEKMISISSKERQAVLGEIVGPENVQWVNAALESKILLKDQRRGMVSWAKKVAGLSEPVRRDLISRVQRENRLLDPENSGSFLESLAAKTMGHEISFAEAKNVSSLASQVKVNKARVKETDPIKSDSRLAYGAAVVRFKDYVGELKQQAGKVGPMWYVKHPFQSIHRSAGVAKSMLSTLDNSFFGRQGIKVLWTNPDIWLRGFVKSWGDIGKELAGRDAMFAIRSDVYSRPNSLNGKYAAAKLDLGIGTEEAFPSHFPSRIPILGRVFKGAESAFNGGAMRFRADIGDRVIAAAERNGVNVLDSAQVEPLGRIVNSLTGRGNIGRLDAFGQEVNALIFSVKFLKANFDTLTAHQFQKDITPYARRVAAMNMVKILGGISGTLTLANLLSPGSADLDPRSSRFGKIKVGNTTFDITGGMASLATLAARMVPTQHKGKWGFYVKGTDGKVRELGTAKFGIRSPLDVAWDFTQGKFAPYMALLRDWYRGEDFHGNQTYVEGKRYLPAPGAIIRAHAPIPAQNFVETMNDPKAAPLLLTTILDGLGIGANTYSPKQKNKKPKTFKEAMDDLRQGKIRDFLTGK